MRNDDFGFYGKGLDGYVHYRQGMQEAAEHAAQIQQYQTYEPSEAYHDFDVGGYDYPKEYPVSEPDSDGADGKQSECVVDLNSYKNVRKDLDIDFGENFDLGKPEYKYEYKYEHSNYEPIEGQEGKYRVKGQLPLWAAIMIIAVLLFFVLMLSSAVQSDTVNPIVMIISLYALLCTMVRVICGMESMKKFAIGFPIGMAILAFVIWKVEH